MGRRCLKLGAGALVIACGGGPRDEQDSVTTAPTGVSMTAAGDDDGGASDGDDGPAGESSESGDQKFDVGMGMGSANPDDDSSGCDKVDFLFIIDNSGSMGDEQQNLIATFPNFIDTIQTTLDEAQDYHVMVLDVDAWLYEGCEFACDPPAQCIDAMGNCNAFQCIECISGLPCSFDNTFECGVTMPMECEDVLGAGVTWPRGGAASNMNCNFSSGARYMDASEPNLAETFACAAQVGTSSYALTEKPMEAMVQAVTPGTPAFACNEGFIRDDAILVVTFITDENDMGDSGGTPAGWKQALVAAKNGDESAIVVLGLFGDIGMPGAICQELTDMSTDGAEPAPLLAEFVNSFGDHGFFGSVCAPDYDPFFQQAVALIDTTCEEFVPPQG